jgi:hypothetical protein
MILWVELASLIVHDTCHATTYQQTFIFFLFSEGRPSLPTVFLNRWTITTFISPFIISLPFHAIY